MYCEKNKIKKAKTPAHKYFFVRELLFEKEKDHKCGCLITGFG